jgi:hypothetical protein
VDINQMHTLADMYYYAGRLMEQKFCSPFLTGKKRVIYMLLTLMARVILR